MQSRAYTEDELNRAEQSYQQWERWRPILLLLCLLAVSVAAWVMN